MYSEPTLTWIDGSELRKVKNPPHHALYPMIVEESSWVNRSLGLSIMATMEQLPGLSPFLHVSFRNHRREMTMEEIRYIHKFFFPEKFVKVTPTNYLPGQPTYHMIEASMEEAFGISKN